MRPGKNIKPENILYSNTKDCGPILIDLEFATSQRAEPKEMKQLWEFRDLHYCGPEIHELLYNKKQRKQS